MQSADAPAALGSGDMDDHLGPARLCLCTLWNVEAPTCTQPGGRSARPKIITDGPSVSVAGRDLGRRIRAQLIIRGKGHYRVLYDRSRIEAAPNGGLRSPNHPIQEAILSLRLRWRRPREEVIPSPGGRQQVVAVTGCICASDGCHTHRQAVIEGNSSRCSLLRKLFFNLNTGAMCLKCTLGRAQTDRGSLRDKRLLPARCTQTGSLVHDTE